MRPMNMFLDNTEGGRASLEFLVLSILLILPVMFLGMSLASIQGATIAAETAARNAVRIFVQETSESRARTAVERSVAIALSNHGIDRVAVLERECSRSPCLSPGGVVTIRVGVHAPLTSTDLIPGAAGDESRLVVAEASGVVSRYGGVR